jgi:hypothetical protein
MSGKMSGKMLGTMSGKMSCYSQGWDKLYNTKHGNIILMEISGLKLRMN